MYDLLGGLDRELGELENAVKKLENSRSAWMSTPAAAFQEQLLKRYQEALDKGHQMVYSYECIIKDKDLIVQVMRFYDLSMTWLMRLADPGNNGLPLPAEPPTHFINFPEFYAEDPSKYLTNLTRYSPDVLRHLNVNVFMDFANTFINSSSYVKNPYLRAKLVEVLFWYTPDIQARVFNQNVELSVIFDMNQKALKYLAGNLMKFYVDVESTGQSVQFYAKFSIRYNISLILKGLWKNSVHKANMKAMSKEADWFVRFVNLLMNDATYLLDESLRKLMEIHEIQSEMADVAQWSLRPQEARQEREGTLRQYERQSQSYVLLANETVHMLQYLTSEIVEPFLRPEIIDRLAAMLDYNLEFLVGPKCSDLKVKNPEKYHFDPKFLLGQLIDIYIHLFTPEFVAAVARDGRSYRKEYFLKAIKIGNEKLYKPAATLEKMQEFLFAVEANLQSDKQQEEEMGDVPDEFLDPLMFTVMEDPVILPTSNISIDRKTIVQHLLSDSTDPFNRKPLKIDDIVPNVELKQKIEEFRKSKSRR